jgi:uncharacterized membrane protein
MNTAAVRSVYFAMRPVLLPVHIVGGGVAIILGAIALLSPKGRPVHRRAGQLFVYAMLTMGVSGSVLALRQSLTNANVIGGVMVSYFVVTALTTVRPPSAWSRRLDAAALVVGLALAAFEITIGVKALESPRGMIDGVPYGPIFFLAAITLAGVAGDMRVMRTGARRGGARLARHLWRMCFALFIASASFFSIRARVARVLPEPFTTGPMRAVPVLLVFVAMFYWLWRVQGRRAPVFAG